jgi:phosphonate transport system substrate-binding protein
MAAFVMLALAVAVSLTDHANAHEGKPLEFGVISQRSPLLTAQYWNPILTYVGRTSGVPLRLRIGKSGMETNAMINHGTVDFIYSNHIFHPENDGAGYHVIARDGAKAISGQIVVPEGSQIRTLKELTGKYVAFPSKVAFVGYMVPIHALHEAKVKVVTRFAGNQEGAMGQLVAGTAEAIGVNSEVMREFAEREKFAYRVIWSSKPYLSMPIAAKSSVPSAAVEAVRNALIGMKQDPEGRKILETCAKIIGEKSIEGFEPASDGHYEEQKRLYRLVVKMTEKAS